MSHVGSRPGDDLPEDGEADIDEYVRSAASDHISAYRL